MTAVAVHSWARPQVAVAPAPSDAQRRLRAAVHEPNTWMAGVVVATGLLLLARHPIARLIGTEVDVPPAPVPTSAPPAPSAGAHLPSLSAPVLAAPTHAPRDPFRALVAASGKVLVAPAAPAAQTASPGEPTAASSSCIGTTYHVAAGDSLWSLAAKAVRSSDSGRVTIAWHRIYAANRAALGADPALLQVGETLCLPRSI